MNKLLIVLNILLVLLITLSTMTEALAEKGNGMSSAGRAHSSAPTVIIHMRHMTVPQPQRIQNQNHIINDQQHMRRPEFDNHGAAIIQREVRTPPPHQVVMRNSSLMHSIAQQSNNETQHNHFFWHQANGLRYAHYIDDNNNHWYGFYYANSFYWTRHYEGRWWWYDQNYNRWSFWSDGFWWWPASTDSLYVYINNNYYPYEDAQNGVTVMQPEVQQPPSDIPDLSQGVNYNSPDGRRAVLIYGPQSAGFLYDVTGDAPAFIKYLGSNVQSVEYSGKTSGKPLQILVRYLDGSFALLDADGNALSSPAVPAESETLTDQPVTDILPDPGDL